MHRAIWLAAGCLACDQAIASDRYLYQPFDTRDQNLFNLIHGQPLPTNAQLTASGTDRYTVTLVTTNALNIENNGSEQIYLDYETYRLNLAYQYGLTGNWNIKLDIPILHQGSGMFDSAIDNWHQFWGFRRGNRPVVEHNHYQVSYANLNTDFQLDDGSTSLGDIQLAVARRFTETERSSLSLWAAIKLPTGDEKRLAGNGAYDLSGWFSYNYQLASTWLLNVNSGLVLPGTDEYNGMAISDYALFGSLMLNWNARESLGIKLQLQGHTSYYDNSRLKILGDTYLLTFGSSIRFDCATLDIAMSEDVLVDASPDTSLIISWHQALADSDCD
jgi:hypothetical protein